MAGRGCRWVKRGVDILVSGVSLLLFSPLLLLLAGIVSWKLGWPFYFCQQRPGQRARPFVIYKLRTMTNGRDSNGKLLPDDQRLTGIGRFLRSTSLDELLGLYNVLKGDMSLIGPRPLLMEYLDYYSPEQARRHEVKPGITGWAQVNGRNAISWEEKFRLDVWYVDHQSLWLDLKILWLTLVKVVRREGISAEGYATAPFFMGNTSSKEKD